MKWRINDRAWNNYALTDEEINKYVKRGSNVVYADSEALESLKVSRMKSVGLEASDVYPKEACGVPIVIV